MKTLSEKLDKAQCLNDALSRANKFLKLLNQSLKATGDNEKEEIINNLRYIRIGSDVCTGSQNCAYEESLYDDTVLTNRMAFALIPLCEARIGEIELELKEIIK